MDLQPGEKVYACVSIYKGRVEVGEALVASASQKRITLRGVEGRNCPGSAFKYKSHFDPDALGRSFFKTPRESIIAYAKRELKNYRDAVKKWDEAVRFARDNGVSLDEITGEQEG